MKNNLKNENKRNSIMIIDNKSKRFSYKIEDDINFFKLGNLSENIEKLKIKSKSISDEESLKISESYNSKNINCSNSNSNSEMCKLRLENIFKDENRKIEIKTNEILKLKNNILPLTENKRNLEDKLNKVCLSDRVITKSINKNSNLDNITASENIFDSLASKSPLAICFLCENYSVEKNNFLLKPCNHFLCKKCFKAFYEDHIEFGEVEFKCPVYKCKTKIHIEMDIYLNVSEKHFESLIKNIQMKNISFKEDVSINLSCPNNEENIKNSVIKKNISLKNSSYPISNNQAKTNMIENLKIFTKHHVIEISNDESFLLFTKYKSNFCNYCHEPSLYGKVSGKLVKCLNCFQLFCKFCLKINTPDHFEINSNHYCKILIKNKNRSLTNHLSLEKTRKITQFMINVLIIIIDFFIIFYFIYLYFSLKIQSILDNIFSKIEKKLILIKYTKQILNIFLNVINLVITCFIGLISLPYFPAINSLIEYI